MSYLPEDPVALIKMFGETMNQEASGLHWYSSRAFVGFWPIGFLAEGYKDKKGIFKHPKIKLFLPPERDTLLIMVNDPNYYNYGEKIRDRAERGLLFGSVQNVELARTYFDNLPLFFKLFR
jgi:hypothetical protein